MVDSGDLELQKRFGQNVATRRKSLGWTQEYLAQHMGVETETISRFERGVTAPSLKTVQRLAALLTIRIADLLSEEEPAKPGDLEVFARMLEPLTDDDKHYVMESFKSLCHYIAGVRRQGAR